MERRLKYKILKKIFNFGDWHLTPADERPYAQCIIKKVNNIIKKGNLPRGGIIEIGCGLGDIIGSIKWKQGMKIGYDIDKGAVKAGKFANPGVNFRYGSFDDISGEKISLAISVNFLHAIEDSTLRELLKRFFENNEVDRIIVDYVPSPPYQHEHAYNEIMSENGYLLEWKSQSFAAVGKSRRVLYMFRRENV